MPMSPEIEQRIARSFEAQGLMATLGARLAWVGDGEVHIAMPNSPQVSQQHGYVHAGAVTSIVDSACGYAALSRATPEFAGGRLIPFHTGNPHVLGYQRPGSAGTRILVLANFGDSPPSVVHLPSAQKWASGAGCLLLPA